jgi:hypothetical protein
MATFMFRPVPVDQEPKRKNRFVLEFPTELGIESYLVQTAKKPSATINKVEIPYMNTKSYVAGQYWWEEINVSFIDVIGPSTSQKLMEWIRLHFEQTTGKMGYAVAYKKNLILKALDPVGVEVEKWTLIGTQITKVDFEDFDYGSDDLAKVNMTLQPDRCILSA